MDALRPAFLLFGCCSFLYYSFHLRLNLQLLAFPMLNLAEIVKNFVIPNIISIFDQVVPMHRVSRIVSRQDVFI